MIVAVIICSAHRYPHKRAAVRDTWVKRLPADWPYFFYVGHGDSALEPDVVKLDAPDGYNDLPPKTQLAIKTACADLRFDWLIRLDDDTYFVPSRLPSLIEQATTEYIGSNRGRESQYATGGAGVVLSRRLAELIAAQPTPQSCPFNPDQDDGWIGLMVRNAGNKLYWSPRLHHDQWFRPSPQNDIITGHWVIPSEMRVLDHAFNVPDRHIVSA